MAEEPKVVVFCCNWSVDPGLRLSIMPSETRKDPFTTIVTMCCGRVDPELILEAFSNGAWGVMVAGCPPEECSHDGNYKTRRRVLMLKNALGEFNIEPERLALEWFSTGEAEKLRKTATEFSEMIAQMGPIKNNKDTRKEL